MASQAEVARTKMDAETKTRLAKAGSLIDKAVNKVENDLQNTE